MYPCHPLATDCFDPAALHHDRSADEGVEQRFDIGTSGPHMRPHRIAELGMARKAAHAISAEMVSYPAWRCPTAATWPEKLAMAAAKVSCETLLAVMSSL